MLGNNDQERRIPWAQQISLGSLHTRAASVGGILRCGWVGLKCEALQKGSEVINGRHV